MRDIDVFFEAIRSGDKDRLEAFKCYKKASDMGNSRGMNNCGLMYEGGFEGNPPDLEKAE